MDAQNAAPDTDPHWLIVVMDVIQHWGEARFIKRVVEIALFMSFRIVSADATAVDSSIEFVAAVCNIVAAYESNTSSWLQLNIFTVS